MKGFVLALSCSLVFSSCVTAKTISDTEFVELSKKCAPNVSADTLKALVRTESSYNPFAIAVVGGSVRQPNNLLSALNTVKELEEKGMNYSLGLGQINKKNFKMLGVKPIDMFEPCENLKATQKILSNCYQRTDKSKSEGKRLADAFSCYYSGNEITGYRHGYVQTVVRNADVPSVKKITPNDLNIGSKNTSSCDGLLCQSKADNGLIF